MSLKPPRKSDLDKKWMRPRRDIPRKIEPEYHLIVTEGSRTEPYYFGAIRDIINKSYPNRLNISIFGAGDNTLNLIQKAKQLAFSSINGFSHVWVVYDTDDFPAEHVNEAARLCAEYSTEETVFHAIWSNQCIELWYLLHFSFMHSDIRREEYWPKLSSFLKTMNLADYNKNRKDIYFILLPFLNNAIYNAEKLDKMNKGKLPSESAPATKVFELINKLKPYLME